MKMAEQAVLVPIRMTRWSNKYSDKKLSGEIAELKKARPGTIRANVDLTDNRAALELASLYGRINNGLIKKLTLPWRTGTHLLPANLIDEFEKQWNESVIKWDTLIEELRVTYDASVEAARKEITGLGLVFNEHRYPSVDEVISKYSIEKDTYELLTRPENVNDLRIDIGQQRADSMKRAIEEKMEAAAADANRHVQERIVKALSALVDGLQRFGTKSEGHDRTSTFRDYTVTKLGEIATVCQHLNVTDNGVIHTAIEDIKRDLSDLNPEALREDASQRRNVGTKAKKIIADLEGLY